MNADQVSASIPDLPIATGFADDKTWRRLLWLVVGIGVMFRIGAYLWNTGFWYDEGWLIQSLQDKSYTELIGGLANDQAAPLVYLWLLKALYVAFGLSELALRLPSVVAGVIGMILMLPLARRMLSARAVLPALILAAACEGLQLYSTRTKPYAIDALAATLLLYAAVRLKDAPIWKYILVTGLMEAALFWISYPSCFVYGGIATMGFFRLLGMGKAGSGRGRVEDWIALVVVNIAVAGSLYSMLHLTGSQRTDMLMTYWGDRGFPMGWSFRSVMKWPVDATYRVFHQATWPMGGPALAAGILAAVMMLRDPKRRFVAGLLVLPMALNILAASLKLYPWVGERISMYTAPIVILLTAEGLAEFPPSIKAAAEWLAQRLAKTATKRLAQSAKWIKPAVAATVASVVVVIILGVPLAVCAYRVAFDGHCKAHGRPLAQYVLTHAQADDHVVIAGSNEFGIYFRKARCAAPVVGGEYANTTDPADVLNKNWNHCWLLVRLDNKPFRELRDKFLAACPAVGKWTAHDCELYLLEKKGGRQ